MQPKKDDYDILNFGHTLRSAIDDNKISLQELASKTGLSYSVIHKYTRDKTTPSLEIAYLLSKELGFSLDNLSYRRDAYYLEGKLGLSKRKCSKWVEASILNADAGEKRKRYEKEEYSNFLSAHWEQLRSLLFSPYAPRMPDVLAQFLTSILSRYVYFFSKNGYVLSPDGQLEVDKLAKDMDAQLDAMTKIWVKNLENIASNERLARQIHEKEEKLEGLELLDFGDIVFEVPPMTE